MTTQANRNSRQGWWIGLRLLPRSLIVTLAALFLVSVGIMVLGELTLRASAGYSNQTAEVLRRLDASARLKGMMIDAEAGQRGFLLTGDSRFLVPFEQASREFDQALRELTMLCTTPALRTVVERIKELGTERIGVASTSIILWETGEHENAIGIVRDGRGKELTDQLRDAIAELDALSQDELRDLRRYQAPVALRTRIATLLSSMLAIGLLLTVTRLFMQQAAGRNAEAVTATSEAQRMQSLIDARTAELSALSSHLQEVSEREKAELARNLHDELGGLLTAARMDLAWLLGATKSLDPEIRTKLGQINDSLTESMDIKRRVVESLRPALLDHFGISTALRNYFEESCVKAGLNCSIFLPEDLTDLRQDLAIALFRAGQESLTNVIRHANATNVTLSLEADTDVIRLMVTDDGTGMDMNSRNFRASHGITGMRHRVRALGGTFKLDSAPDTGTCLEISVPRTKPVPRIPFAEAAP